MSPAVADDDDAARLPRVLCLTGTASGQRIMEVQLSRLLREAKGRVEFVIYEGERDCTMPEPLEIMSAFFKGLPMKMYDELTFDERNWRCYKDVRGTLATLQRVLKTQGPFDGVLGFSQGANFAVMLAAQSYTGAGQPFSFVVPMCPNAPGYVGQLPELFEEPVPMPALVVRGQQEGYDEGVKKTLAGARVETLGEDVVSDHVVKLFSTPQVFTHPDGHRPIPTRPTDQAALIDKILGFILESAQLPPVVRDSVDESSASKPLWRVADGAGGRVVREGCGLGTKELVETLRPGAVVEELELRGSRLHYRLVSGSGPERGWVTTRAKAGELLRRLSEEEAGLTGEIWIVTMGTRGDLQPFVVLGMALQQAGYDLRLFGPPELGSFSRASGLRFTVSCAGWSDGRDLGQELTRQAEDAPGPAPEEAAEDSDSTEEPQEGEARGGATGAKPGESEGARFVHFLQAIGVDTTNAGDVGHLGWLFGEMPKTISILREEMASKKPDLLIYNHLMVNVGQLFWRQQKVRTVFANLGMEFHFAPSGEDIFNYKTLSAFDRFVVMPRAGVAPIAEMSHEDFAAIYTSPDRLLGTTKLIREVLPTEAQAMSKEWKFTGFWVMESAQQVQEPGAFGGPEVLQRLEEFLAAGSPPVYLGWGSMPTLPNLLVVVVKALRSVGLRAIIVKGWGSFNADLLRSLVEAAEKASDPQPEPSPPIGGCEGLCEYADENVLFLDKAPHEWLFPRCACTVHHGGAGTTAAALRAGVPTIVVPVAYDQWYHGDWVVKLGVGIKASKYDEVTPEELADALRRATSDAEMRQRSMAVAETLRREPGVDGAVAKLRQVLRDDVRSGAAQARWEAEEEARRAERQLRFERLKARRAERQQRQLESRGAEAVAPFEPPSRA